MRRRITANRRNNRKSHLNKTKNLLVGKFKLFFSTRLQFTILCRFFVLTNSTQIFIPQIVQCYQPRNLCIHCPAKQSKNTGTLCFRMIFIPCAARCQGFYNDVGHQPLSYTTNLHGTNSGQGNAYSIFHKDAVTCGHSGVGMDILFLWV